MIKIKCAKNENISTMQKYLKMQKFKKESQQISTSAQNWTKNVKRDQGW